MKVDRSDIIAFILGIGTSVIANIVWEKYKENKKQLAFGEKQIISEMHSAIDGLKDHLNKSI
jgi:hypothetical protein